MFNFKNSNSGKIKVKLLATLLVLTLTFANFALAGSYIGEAIAAEIDLTKQDNSTNDNNNVKFELCFVGTEKVSQISKDINSKDLVLYAKVSVENAGILENAKIELTDTSFKLQENVDENNLNLGTLRAGESKELELPIEIKKDANVFNLGLLNMFSKVTLTGVYTNGDNEININTDKYVQVNWTSEAIDQIQDEEQLPIELTQELITNKIYNIAGTNKRVIQYKITSGITDNKYPIKSTTIELQAPKYDETTKQMLTKEEIVEGVNWVAPEKALVTAYSLNASNPNEILNFKEYETVSEDNIGFVYNQTDGIVNINVTNKENEKNEITWNKGKDEFIVTYIYPADIVVSTIESVINSKIALHDLDNRVLSSKDNINKQTITPQIAENGFGDIITFEANANSAVYKSNMYIGGETLYNTKWTAKISCANIAEKIKITNGPDSLKTEEDQDIEAQSYYKNTYINKQELDYILGDQGSLKIYDSANSAEPLIEINNLTEGSEDGLITIENGNIAVNYKTEVETIVIEILNPANAGLLNIYNQKAVKKTISDEMTEETKAAILEEISSAKKLETTTRLFAMQGETEIVKENAKTNTIDLQEPVSEAEFDVTNINGTKNFATLQENDISFTVTLKTDDIKYNLYDAPEIVITLPDVVEKIENVNAVMMNKNALDIESADPENNTIKIKLSGKQESYANLNEQISVNAKITTQKLIPTIAKDIIMTLTNGKDLITKSQTVNFESEQGMLLATTVSNYNSENKTITAFGENKTGTLETGKEARIATVKGTVINNTKTDLEEIKIFGKVQNSGTSIGAALNTEIAVAKAFGENANLEAKVYYTEDANPSLESNWTETATANTTAYLIICKNFAKATALEFGYGLVIPENLTTNKEAVINYEVYSNNEAYSAPEVKLQTPKEVKLNLELTANVQNGQEVYEGQNITYNIKVTNTGEVDAQNVQMNCVANGLTITEGQAQLQGLNIKAGESTETIEIKAIVNKEVNGISFSAEAKTDYLMQEAKSTITNTVAKPQIGLELNKSISTYSESAEIAQIGSSIIYQLKVTNVSNEEIKEIQIVDKLPEELKFEKAYKYKYKATETERPPAELLNNYNEQTRQIDIKIDNLKPGETATLIVYTNVEKVIDENIINSFNVTAHEKYPDVVFNITDTTKVIGFPNVTSSIASNASQNVKAGDIIEYTIKVKNSGETTEFINIEDEIPEELSVQSACYYYVEGEQREATINLNSVSLNSMELKQNQELTIKIAAKVKEIENNKEIENYATITGRFTNQTTETIRNTIIGTGEKPSGGEGGDSEDVLGGQTGTTQGTYSISGIAWQDENTNGERENEEKLLSNIVVKLIDANTNEYILDAQGAEIQQVTNENGIYEFVGLKPGKYIVVFDYNKTTYSLTTYQKTGVDSTINSDARLVTEENNNIVKTDILEISNQNISNIDIGLILNPIFDLKLDKYITKVTVQNERGTKVYEYDKTQLAKVEIPAKVLEGSLIIIEYQIDVTNEGAIPAHVDTIVDYVSPQFEFISELNTNWYQGEDKNLYCIEFANEDLEPGKTLSSKLVLTKTMTNDNIGLVNNAAEIYETFNEYAYEDIDSVPGNKGEEDDLSQADIIISIQTGGPLLYIGIVIISMFILSAGIYLINKKVIKSHII